MATKRVVIAGGGLAGSMLAHLLDGEAGMAVTLIDSKEYFEIKWATLRPMVEPSFAKKVVIPHSSYLKSVTIKVGVLAGVSAGAVQLEDGSSVPYDFLVIATGVAPEPTISVQERLAYFAEENKKIKAARSVVVIGGGPTGVEFSAEVVTEYPDKKVTIVHAGDRLMEFVKPAASAKALKWLKAKKVEVVLGDRVEPGLASGTIVTQKGKSIEADYVFVGISGKPNLSWLSGLAGAVDKDGRVNVNLQLQVEGYPHIFAAGDVTNIKENKQGYFAIQHATKVAANIKKIIAEGDAAKGLKTHPPGPDLVMVSLGKTNGVAQLPFGTFTGWFPANMKSKTLFVPKVRKELGLAD